MQRATALPALLVALVVGGWLGATAGSAGADSPSAGLSLDPSQGPPFQRVTFQASHFCASSGCGDLVVSFSGTEVAHARVGADGAAAGTFTVPASPAGWQRVVASQSGGPTATALFFVAPEAPRSPAPSRTNTTTPPAHPAGPVTATTAPATHPATPRTSSAAPTQPSTSPSSPSTPSTPVTSTSATPAASTSTTSASGGAAWPYVVVALIAAAGAVTALLLWRHRSRRGSA